LESLILLSLPRRGNNPVLTPAEKAVTGSTAS
jgi:hypothetical protein